LTLNWNNGSHPFSGLLDQARIEENIDGLDKIAKFIARTRDKTIVILGHTHVAKLIDASSFDGTQEGPVNVHMAIYANCGSWCAGDNGSYVIDEYDEDKTLHKVTLMGWIKNKPQEEQSMTILNT
jgi:UDP-2,3-diacylglucosamine pyrophosphatase LpxH